MLGIGPLGMIWRAVVRGHIPDVDVKNFHFTQCIRLVLNSSQGSFPNRLSPETSLYMETVNVLHIN